MTEAYNQHAVRELLDRVLKLENEQALHEPEVSANEIAAHGRDQILTYCKLFKEQIDATPAVLGSTHMLNQLNGLLQQIYNEITSYISNRNIGHLHNAAAQADQGLPPLYATVASHSPTSGPGGTAGRLAVDTLEAAAIQSLKNVDEAHRGLGAALVVTRALIDQQDNRLAEMATAVAKQAADAAFVVATVSKEYAESEAKRSANHAAQAQDMDDRFGKLVVGLDRETAGLLKRLAQHQSDAERIVQVVGNVGITGNYQRIAASETKQANIWRILTLGFFALGVELALLTFLKFYDEPFQVEHTTTVVIRLLFAIAITAPAWYTAGESARHRTNSDRARQTELELAALGPFIELMDKEKKDAIREELSKKYFANKVDEHRAEPPVSPKDLKDLIEAIKLLKS